MTISQIDGDIVAFRCAASCEKQEVVVEPLEAALLRCNESMQTILQETGADAYNAFLTGSNNFRYKYNPEYKANRTNRRKPEWLQQCREYLVLEWKAKVTDGNEADDELGIAQTANPENSIICSIDKDLLQVPGRHYNFVKKDFSKVSPNTAVFNFYWQCIMGDRSDNIFGFDGVARTTVPKKLESLYEELQITSMGDEKEVFDIVRDKYDDDERLLMNGRCLYIQRKPDELWEFPT